MCLFSAKEASYQTPGITVDGILQVLRHFERLVHNHPSSRLWSKWCQPISSQRQGLLRATPELSSGTCMCLSRGSRPAVDFRRTEYLNNHDVLFVWIARSAIVHTSQRSSCADALLSDKLDWQPNVCLPLTYLPMPGLLTTRGYKTRRMRITIG